MGEERDDGMFFFQHIRTVLYVYFARHGKESVAKSTGTLMIIKILASVKWHDFNLILQHTVCWSLHHGTDVLFHNMEYGYGCF